MIGVMMVAASTTVASERSHRSRYRRLFIVLGAVLLNLVILGVAALLAGSVTVAFSGSAPMMIAPESVVVATLVPLAVGGLAHELARRPLPRLAAAGRWAGAALALASITAPVTGATEAASGIALAAMHLVAGAAWLSMTGSRR